MEPVNTTKPAAKPRAGLNSRYVVRGILLFILGCLVADRIFVKRYHNATLDQWFERVDDKVVDQGVPQLQVHPPAIAIMDAGTNAAPFLWDKYTNPQFGALDNLKLKLNTLSQGKLHFKVASASDRKRRALLLLHTLEEDVHVLTPELIQALRDPNENNAYQAVRLLAKSRKSSEISVPALVEQLQSTNRSKNFRSGVVYALAVIGPAARSSVPALRQQFHEPAFANDEYETMMLAFRILQINGAGPELDVLTRILDSTNQVNRGAAAELLGVLEETAHAALPALQQHSQIATNADEIKLIKIAIHSISTATSVKSPTP